MTSILLRGVGVVGALVLSVAAAAVQAQPHEAQTPEHVLRASTVDASSLPDAMRRHHGIPLRANTGVLNVILLRLVDGHQRNVPAELDVRARNLYGIETPVEMRQVVADGFVSYLGVYDFVPHQVLDFRITARPVGKGAALTLEFRDRLGQR